MKRSISTIGLLFASVSAIIGSGWLFSALYTAMAAGPASLLAWLIGGILVIIIAFVFAEICAMLPVSGSSVRIPQFTHGTVVSFIFAWIIWLSCVGLMVIEVQGVVQYLSFYFPNLVVNHGDKLSHIGYIIAIFLLIIITAINVYSTRWLIRCNNTLTIMKILIPVFISVVVLIYFLTPAKILHPAGSAFMPFGYGGVLSAITVGGIVFAFNGFKQAAEIAGEAKNPERALPFALVGSVLFCMIIYLLIQLAFNASITPADLVHGWQQLDFNGSGSPMVAVAKQDKLDWLIPLIYIGAIIAPFAASLMLLYER